MRKKVGAKKVGGERERREEQEKVLGAWRVAAAKGQVPREDEGGADPTQRAIKAVGRRRWKRGVALCGCAAGTVQD